MKAWRVWDDNIQKLFIWLSEPANYGDRKVEPGQFLTDEGLEEEKRKILAEAESVMEIAHAMLKDIEEREQKAFIAGGKWITPTRDLGEFYKQIESGWQDYQREQKGK